MPSTHIRPGARALRPTHIQRAVRTLLIATTASAGAFPVLAQTSAALPAITVTEQSSEGYAAKRSITATKTDTPLIDTPQSISVVTRDQLRDQGAQSLAEAARYVPGVGFAQGEGNRETPIFRGISTTGDFFIDGIRDDVQYYRDLYNIEAVEVFRGPNAMIFGRGATGGLINRVSKQAGWTPVRAASVTVGSYGNRRATVDLNQPINEDLAFRLNGMYENSDTYRRGVNIERWGINPTLTWKSGIRTVVTLGYEHFKDDRIADRGISSFRGVPVDTSPRTFFGNAAGSPSGTKLDALTVSVDHNFDSGLSLRNRTRLSTQDKFYQNVFPGAVNAAGTGVAINAYNNATSRDSFFNQTDLTYDLVAGGLKHKLLAGVELGQQNTDNFRNTGFFPGGATSVTVPLSNPTMSLPITYAQSATDADNKGKAKVAAIYLQDQIEINRQFQIIAGLRYDHFKVDFRNNRTNTPVDNSDGLTSPRLGLIYKPVDELSLYANYSIAYQPRAGDQLASLTLTNAALKPEKFKNLEVGAKWDIRPSLSATAAIFQLDRTNVVVLDPADPTNTRTILSDGQRSRGLELALNGRISPAWNVAAAYTYTKAEITADTTTTLRDGATIAQVPRHSLAVWNRYDFTPAWGAAAGVIHRTKMFAANELIATTATPIPNVELPSYTRVDAAVFWKISPQLQAQLNVENLFDKKYYLNANSNTNITPGSPRAMRVTLNASF